MWSSCRLEGKKGKRSFDVGKCERTSCRRQVLWELRFEDRPGCVSLLAPACLCVGGCASGCRGEEKEQAVSEGPTGEFCEVCGGGQCLFACVESAPRPPPDDETANFD
jgi:hypothetical protein